jgi:hypothetical protein
MGRKPRQLPDVRAWEPLYLQMIAFHTGLPALPHNWWADVVGQEPAESTKRRGTQEDKGLVDGRMLSVQTDVLRVVWQAMPNPEEAANPDTAAPFATLGALPDATTWFSGVVTRWLDQGPIPIKRLGFGCALRQPTASHDSGYELLGRYLSGSVKLSPHSGDFFYRINRRRCFEPAGLNLAVNRLSTWSLQVFQVQMYDATSAPAQLQTLAIGAKLFSCSLELDINTAPERQGPIPPEALSRLFRELVRMGEEIAARGDIE